MQIRFFKNAHIVQYMAQNGLVATDVPGIKEEDGTSSNAYSTSSKSPYSSPFDLGNFSAYMVKATNDVYDFNAYNCNSLGSTTAASATKRIDVRETTILLKVTAGDSDIVLSKFYFFTAYKSSGIRCLQWCIDLEKEVTVPANTSKEFSYTLKWA